MNKNFNFKLCLLATSLFLLSGCSQRVGDFTVISTKNTELGQKFVRTNLKAKTIGIDSKPTVVFIPFGTPSIKEAVDKALESEGAQVLTDVVVYYDYYYIPYIYGETKYRVEGTAWKKTDLNEKAKNDLDSAEAIYVLQQKEGDVKFVKVTKNEPIFKTIH